MPTTIVTTSRSPHGNTRRIADVLASELEADVVEPGPADRDAVRGADLVGFGSGMYLMNFADALRDFVDELPEVEGATRSSSRRAGSSSRRSCATWIGWRRGSRRAGTGSSGPSTAGVSIPGGPSGSSAA